MRRNEVVFAEQIAAALWDGAAPPSAREALHVHVSQLRRALGIGADAICTTAREANGYACALEGTSFAAPIVAGALANSQTRDACGTTNGDPYARLRTDADTYSNENPMFRFRGAPDRPERHGYFFGDAIPLACY